MKLKSFISTLLVISLAILSPINIVAQEIGIQDETIFQEEDSVLDENSQQVELEEEQPEEELVEEQKKEQVKDMKTYSEASIEEDFTEESILITLSHEVSFEDPSMFTAECLGLTNVLSIEPLFEETRQAILDGESHLQGIKDTFNQILKVTLRKQSKPEVLSMIRKADQNPSIISSSPDYFMTPTAYYPLDDPGIGYNEYYFAYDQINLYRAWNQTTGNSNVKVGVMDTGIANLPDLTPNLVPGYDFYNDELTTEDTVGHGTMVASVIGAAGNNGIGISGICQNISLVPLKVADSSGEFSISAQIKALNYANINIIPIINHSGGTFKVSGQEYFYAIENYYGLYVTPAGNEGIDIDQNLYYPAAYNLDNMIVVGATNSILQSVYNYGIDYIHVAAPGYEIKVINMDGDTVTANGTSLAAPMVSGTAALLLSQNITLSTSQLKNAILTGAMYKYDLISKVDQGRFLNVAEALNEISPKIDGGSHHLIDGGDSYSIELREDGTVWTWGDNGVGQLGDGTQTGRITPMQVDNLNNVTSVVAGSGHCMALKEDGTVWTWGSNHYGQLGDNTKTNRTTPVQVQSLSNVIEIYAGYAHSMALKEDGTVWTWGYNSYGQLGDGTNINRTTPVQVDNMSDVTSMSVGDQHSMALKKDGTLWAWGINSFGQLGDGTKTNRTTPVQVDNMSNINSVAAGSTHSMVLKKDGTVWAWGRNNYGQLGDGTKTDRIIPVQVDNLSNVTYIKAKFCHSMALKEDGKIWAWGYNLYGQIGDNTTIHRTTPVQVYNLSNVTSIAAGNYHSMALKEDKTLWTWGFNNYGQLGDGTKEYKKVPVQCIKID